MSQIIYHNHHIIPRHCGGTDDPENMVRLTTADHAEAHRLLFEKYGRWQDELAWKAISGRIGKEEIIRRSQSKGGKMGGALGGSSKPSPDAIQNMSKAHMGQVPWNKGMKTGVVPWNKGKKMPWRRSEEQSKKQSEAQLGKIRGPYKKKCLA